MPIPTKDPTRYQIWVDEKTEEVIGYIPQLGERYRMNLHGVIIMAASLGAERAECRDWIMIDRPMLLEKANPDCKGA